jgi:hypothetical protein
MVGVLMTAACTFDLRNVQLIESDGAAGQGGTRLRDASEEASDARAGTDGAGGMGGRSDASLDGHAGAGGSGGVAGKGGAAGTSGSGGRAGAAGSGGAAGGASGGASGLAGIGGAAGMAGAGGVGGVAGALVGGAAGLAGGSGSGAGGASGAAGRDGGTTGGTAGQGGSATGGSDGGTFDARESGSGGGSLDAADGGVVVLFEENFDSALGTFTLENGCGPTPPAWSNEAGYAHAANLATLGVSSIYSPSITVPAGVSDVRLRMSHKVNTDPGYDGGQLELSVNGAAPRLVTSFIVGPYTMDGVHPHPITCAEVTYPDAWPGWSGNHAEFESAMILSAPPFNVVAGDTVSIRFRMLVDSQDAGIGWDINWVRLTGTPP